MSNKVKVSIGIPAHNEERNIESLLMQLVSQETKRCEIVEIIVVCDGCTDKTAHIVASLGEKYKQIKCVNDGKRLGKSGRINWLFKHHSGEIIICLDADVVLYNNRVIDALAKCFEEKQISIVGGNDRPYPASNLFERIVTAWINHWQSVSRPVNNWVTPNNFHGCVYALRKDLSRKIDIPRNIAADDHYIFYESQRLGMGFSFCNEAVVYYKIPKSFGDYIKQSARFGTSGSDAKVPFGEFAQKYVYISKATKIRAYIASLIKNPIMFSIAIFMQLIIKFQAKLMPLEYSNGIYETIKSSK